jgi:hypothetical protein
MKSLAILELAHIEVLRSHALSASEEFVNIFAVGVDIYTLFSQYWSYIRRRDLLVETRYFDHLIRIFRKFFRHIQINTKSIFFGYGRWRFFHILICSVLEKYVRRTS